MKESIASMTKQIAEILCSCSPSIYLYGSVALDDFKLGWSDIDLICLTKNKISQIQAENLVMLRQKMLEAEPDNKYYRSFEGGMMSLSCFLSGEPDTVVYWGTSGQKITDKYHFDSFSRYELKENGVLLYGEDIRRYISMPSYEELREDVMHHYNSIREFAHLSGRSLYSYGWLLDISRCIYTLRTGRIIAKTSAGVWALNNGLCPVPEALRRAVAVRCSPMEFKDDENTLRLAGSLNPDIQKYADVLERELKSI